MSKNLNDITHIPSSNLASKIWLYAALNLTILCYGYLLLTGIDPEFITFIILFIAFFIGSIPALFVLLIFQPLIKKLLIDYSKRVAALIILFALIATPYSFIFSFLSDIFFHPTYSLENRSIVELIPISFVFISSLISFFINLKYIKIYFESPSKKIHTMEKNLSHTFTNSKQTSQSNKLWIKGAITAGLILLMLIPTLFVSNLVEERQQRQEDVKKEVSSKWAGAQNITFPYLYIPYADTNSYDKSIVTKSFIILPDNLNVTGSVSTEARKRSIYSVLLYSSSLNAKGNFKIELPDGIDASLIKWNEARICFGISDFKGIEQKITASFYSVNYDLTAGLPSKMLDSTGLSSSIVLSANDVGKTIAFEMPLKIKGTDQLHFSQLAGNSNFTLKSDWNSPSFDGNSLPAERNLDNHGFEANWSFNKANLPFNTVLKEFNFNKNDYSFGVSLLQPADQYAKTMRSVKYAILFIGLTFSLFFIVEIMQKKPFHPIQYVLVGLALVIFFTLLLSISEFVLFDYAYLIASVATVSLITFYAKSHFKNWSIASVFAGVIGFIYGFIFVLIRLEDTALLVGSIGLFVILALAMYASRKVNWYGSAVPEAVTI